MAETRIANHITFTHTISNEMYYILYEWDQVNQQVKLTLSETVPIIKEHNPNIGVQVLRTGDQLVLGINDTKYIST